MAATNYTPISLYYSATTTNVPTAGNLVAGELALNTADGKLFYKDSSGVVQTLASKSTSSGVFTSVTDSGLTSGRVTYATTGGLLTDSANMTFNGTTLTLANDASISGLTVGQGLTSGVSGTAFGSSALQANTGSENTGIGSLALYANTTGGLNVSVGRLSMRYNTTGASNTAIGTSALQANTTASNNTAVGYQAGYSTTTSTDNTYFGKAAGYSLTTGSGANVFVGQQTGYSATTGANNAFLGSASGYYMTTGSKNTIIGSYSGNQGGIDIRTASNWVVLSDGDGNPYLSLNQSGGANRQMQFDGVQFYPSPDNTVKLGAASFRWTTVYATTALINTSDATQKQQIRSLDDAEKLVAQSIKNLIKAYKFNDAVLEKGNNARIHIGVIAQEVQAVFEAQGLDSANYGMFCSDTWYELDGKPKAEDGVFYTAETEGAVEITRLGIRYEELLAFVIASL